MSNEPSKLQKARREFAVTLPATLSSSTIVLTHGEPALPSTDVGASRP